MAAALETAFPSVTVTMSPGQRGDFKVTVDGDVRWDKKNREREFPVEAAFIASLRG